MFDDEYVEKLPDDPALAGKMICDDFMSFYTNTPSEKDEKNYEPYLRAIALIQAFSESFGIDLQYPSLSSNITENIKEIANFFDETRGVFDRKFTLSVLDKYKKNFKQKFGAGFLYRFSDGDLTKIQSLINEIREYLVGTKEIQEEHRERLLKRLEKLQSELNKTMSDLDRFWGLLIDGSIVLKKVGENAKPIVDRIQEIVSIVWRVQARAEELPSNIPLELPRGDSDKEL